MSELRKDPLTNCWTVMAPERKGHPGDFVEHMDIPQTHNVCPFCPGNEALTPRELLSAVEYNRWQLRVFPNKYPIFRVEGELIKRGKGFYDTINGIGAHEIIVYTEKHTRLMHEHDMMLFARYFGAVKARMNDLCKDIRFAYLQFFQNHGYHSGATLVHPHGQLLALPVIPDASVQVFENTRAYYKRHKRCLICDIIDGERADKNRIVFENSDFVAICPYAASSPFDICVYPKVHNHDFMGISDTLLLRLGDIMAECFMRLSKILNEPDFQLFIHTSPTPSVIASEPVYSRIALYYHWRIMITPKISRLAGTERGLGFFVNTVLPEESAELLREVSL
ncbi:MAG: galactose-1-phosphate uridylyltransferase [Deferribacteraceae bacterium]|jgi:UDPglucose--hexose-1-phosphate uridylyltransferase|nr:galactose-1-phosphate uridylyltransferase [Deferribacteraceae bacterium]